MAAVLICNPTLKCWNNFSFSWRKTVHLCAYVLVARIHQEENTSKHNCSNILVLLRVLIILYSEWVFNCRVPKALPGKCYGEIRVWVLCDMGTWVWPSWDHCISCTCTTQMADTCLASSSHLLHIRWSTWSSGGCVCCASLRGIPLRSVGLLVNWCIHQQETFAWAFQTARGSKDCLGNCCRKGKISSSQS